MTEVQCVSLLIEETSANQRHAKIKHINPTEAEQRRERKEGWMDRAQYRPILEGLDRPAARGRDWKLLIGGEREVGVAHSSMGADDWPEKHKKKKQKNK